MDIYTLNVGQGQFVVITGKTQAFIVDTFVALNPTNDIINIKGALSKILEGKELGGLIVTGFDADHFNEIGIRIVLNKYRPNWIMYPKYFKETETANTCFNIIKGFESRKVFKRVSVLLSKNNMRFYNELSSEFNFEIFSPHEADMNSSNNCSLVCKVKELSTGRTYLITGDTENDRWNSIVRYFGNALKSDVLDAPHHGSKNGITIDAISQIKPDTILISAGVDNKYGHPDAEARKIFSSCSQKIYSTKDNKGQSIKTVASTQEVNSYIFTI